MVLRCLGASTIYDDDFCAAEFGSMTRFLRYHGLPYYSEDECFCGPITCLSSSLEPVYMQQPEPVFVASPNGTFYLVDCQSCQVLMSFETGRPTYVEHHSEDSKYYLIYGTNNTFRFIKTKSSFFDSDRVELVPCDVEEFIRETPEKYLDGGSLLVDIKTTEYLVDCKTGKIIDTFCADEIQSYQQKPARVEHEHDQLISVKRIDYELAFYSSKTRKCLWYLKFARFDAWYETACNWTPRMMERTPYVKPYIKVFQARYHTTLTQIFLANGIKISSETRRPAIKDEDDTKAIQGISKNKKKKKTKKKAQKAKKDGSTANNTTVPDLNHNVVGFHFVKYPPDLAYYVSKRCVHSLHDLMSLVNNGPQQTTEFLKATELLNNWVKLTRDIAQELANLHQNDNAHGDLNPHNVYIDINNSAIIPKDWLTDEVVSSRSKAMDCYNLGRIILYIASNGAHKFGDTSKGDLNNLKDREDLELIKYDPEAYDITSKLLHLNPLLRPTAAQVCSHRLYWDPERCRSYFEDASEQLKVECEKARKKNIELYLVDDLERITEDVFHGTWDSEIDDGLLKEKHNFRIYKGWDEYNYTSMCDFLRFIKNVCSHYPQIPGVIKNTIGADRDQFVTYTRRVYPKLLTEVYKVFDAYNWNGTVLYKYHV